MTDAKRKDQATKEQATKEHPNLGQDEAAEERHGKDEMAHMEGDTPRREAEKSPQRVPRPKA